MANEEHLALLKQGVEVWNKWKKTNREIKPDLSGADLRRADLRRADLSGARLSRANLFEANLFEADLSDAVLVDAHLNGADLAYTDLSGADLSGADLLRANLAYAYLNGANLAYAYLNGANLSGTKLSRVNLIYADLSEADLSGADLSWAILSRTQALKTNFEGATFTGTCIEDWNINSETNLNNVICDYVYLKQGKQERPPHGERRPHDPNKNFTPGEFTKLFQKALETVDLIFSDGIDWQAFLASFQNLQVECGSDQLAIQAIEKKSGGAFVIRVEVPSEANKAEIEKYIKHEYETRLKVIEDKYQKQLQAKDEELKGKDKEIIKAYREKSTDLLEMARIMASVQKPPIYNNHIEATGNKSVSEAPKYDMRESNFQGGFAEKNYGKMVETQHNYAPEQKQTLPEAAAEIQQLLTQLQSQGYSPEDAQQQAAKDLATKAQESPTTLGKLVKWGQSLGDTAAKTTVSEAAKEVVKLALRLSGVPLP